MKYHTLFLDRDGVINKRLHGDYVTHWEEFQFTPRAVEALAFFSTCFHRIVVVTNQQGIGKGKMSVAQLAEIHEKMVLEIQQSGGRIDAVYYCPDLSGTPNNCRKPASGMARMAQKEFPEISFQHAVMVGDLVSDIEFGQNLCMATEWMTSRSTDQ